MTREVTELAIDDVHRLYESGELTCRELVDRYLDRIEAYDRNGPELNAIVTVNPNATDRAAELDDAYDESGIEAGELDTLTFPTNTVIASQAGLCAVSVPAGLTDDGYPVGVELIGKPYDEATLLSLADAFDRATDHREPPETAPPLE